MNLDELDFRKSTRCSTTSCVEMAFHKSSYSADVSCVEVSHVGTVAYMRDSKSNNDGTILEFNENEWMRFIYWIGRKT